MKATTCGVATCDRVHSAHGYCASHLARLKRWGDVRADQPLGWRKPKDSNLGPCSVETCDRPKKVRDWCAAHYKRVWETGDADAGRPLRIYKGTDDECVVPTCGLPAFCRNWCKAHYWRNYYTGDVRADEPLWQSFAPLGEPCIEDACTKPGVGRGMCTTHYSRFKLARILADPQRHEAFKARHRANKKAEHARDPEIPRQRSKRWRRANPAKFREIAAKHRLRRGQAKCIPFSDDQLKAKLAYWGDRCWRCQVPYEAIDHVKPLARGGWHALMNLRPICTPCNSSKGGRWPYPTTIRR